MINKMEGLPVDPSETVSSQEKEQEKGIELSDKQIESIVGVVIDTLLEKQKLRASGSEGDQGLGQALGVSLRVDSEREAAFNKDLDSIVLGKIKSILDGSAGDKFWKGFWEVQKQYHENEVRDEGSSQERITNLRKGLKERQEMAGARIDSIRKEVRASAGEAEAKAREAIERLNKGTRGELLS